MANRSMQPLREAGTYRCEGCGYLLALHEGEQLPACPLCGSSKFRHTLFDPRDPFGATVETPAAWTRNRQAPNDRPEWLERLADELASEEGCFLAFESDDGSIERVRLQQGWTRIGRSIAAQLRLDDPTVSRRHALIYVDSAGARILDDRSLNGVFVNGQPVELAELVHGDEIRIGRYRLFFVHGGYAGEETAASTERLVSTPEDAVA